MSELDRNDLNLLAEHFQSTPDDEKARQFIAMSPDNRYSYLAQLRAAARSDAITNQKRATLWNVERKLLQIDQELRLVGR
jgi:hypothetical protein